MKTGYSFGSLASFVEQINNTTVKLTGDQVIAGSKTFSSNPISSAAQGSGGAYLTRRDFVENLLSYKAPSDSPVFTGNPTAPTAALFDADTTIATTAFVQRASGNHQSYVWTDDATIQPGWAGCFIWYGGAGTLYLPDYTTVPVGATFEIMSIAGGSISAQSGQTLKLPDGSQITSLATITGDILKFVRIDANWTFNGSSYCATAATGDRSTRPASTQFVRNYLESSPQLAGSVHVEGGVNITQEFATTNAIGYRIAYGNYGAFWYFDEWNMYLMFTNSGDKWGAYNGLRPFSVNCRTGTVAMSNGAGVSNGLTADSFTVTSSATINGHLDIKQWSFIDGGWWRDAKPFSVDGNYASGSAYEVQANQLPLTDSFFPIVGATTSTIDEGYQVRVKFGVYSKSGDGGWGRKHAGIWVGSGESTAGPKYLYKFNVYGGFYCNAVVADTTLTAGTNISAGDTIHAPRLVSSIADQPGLRFTGGPYGVMCYNDSGESFHFLLTNANDQWGGFNNLRPFTINKRTGEVTHQHGLTVFGRTSTNTLTTTDNINAGGVTTTNGLIVTSGADFRAGLTVSGGTAFFQGTLSAMGEISSQNANAFRMVQGNYGVLWRNDGDTLYLLCTNAGDAWGGWNNLRPLMVNLTTGGVSINNGLSVGNGLSVSGATSLDTLTVANNVSFNNNMAVGTSMPGGSGNLAVGNNVYASGGVYGGDIVDHGKRCYSPNNQAPQTILYEGSADSMSIAIVDGGVSGNRQIEILFSDNTNTPTNWASKTISTAFFRKVLSGTMFVDYGDNADYVFSWTTTNINDSQYSLTITEVKRGKLRYIIGIA